MSNNSCLNCRYGIKPANVRHLECRIAAPIPAIIITPGTEPIAPKAVWPIVDSGDWCGGWNQRNGPGFGPP